MKVLVIIASALFAFTAVAGEYSKPSSVHFQAASTWVPAEKVCRDGDVLKHKTKATIEVKYCDSNGNDSDKNCYYVAKALQQPVVSTVKTCLKYTGKEQNGCAKYGVKTLNQSSVALWSYSSAQDLMDGDHPTLSGKYIIPACNFGGAAK